MSELKTPIVVVVTGEGGSGGALALGVGDHVAMLEYATYSVASPEACSIQKTNRADELDYIANILPLASSNGIPVIATNDVIFSNKEDFDIHETKVCINTGKTLNDPNREKKFSNEQIF